MADKDKVIRIVLLVIGIALLAGLFFWQKIAVFPSGFLSGNPVSILENSPSIPIGLIGGLNTEQKTEAEAYKKAVFDKIASGAPFSDKEKEAISLIIQTQNRFYLFSDKEIGQIKSAFK